MTKIIDLTMSKLLILKRKSATETEMKIWDNIIEKYKTGAIAIQWNDGFPRFVQTHLGENSLAEVSQVLKFFGEKNHGIRTHPYINTNVELVFSTHSKQTEEPKQ